MTAVTLDYAAKPKVAVLLACHNRRDLTLRALRSMADSVCDFDLVAVLLDDASTDGTSAAVAAAYPDTIILHGDGNAFWNGGLHQAWSHALRLGVDAYLWLNDDVALDPDALDKLAQAWRDWRGVHGDSPAIFVGATRGSDGTLTYGGMVRHHSPFALKLERHPTPTAVPMRVDTFNGNIVLVPQGVVDRIGINDPAFFHTLGDVDYGLRATAESIPTMLLPGTLGVCEGNTPIDYLAMPLRQRFRHINSHRGVPFAGWSHMTRRHSGFWYPLHFLLAYRRLLYPGRRAVNSQPPSRANP